jgi:hypothetical protein
VSPRSPRVRWCWCRSTASRHGIANNRKFVPKENGNEYYWSATDIKAPTLFAAAHLAGKKTAAVTWPVTAEAPIDLLLPDFHPLDTLDKVFAMLDGKNGPPDASGTSSICRTTCA